MNYLNKLFVVLLIITNTIQPFVSYYLLKKGDNYILILGDKHFDRSCENNIEKLNSYHAHQFIELINTHKVKQKIPFILECGCNTKEALTYSKLSKHVTFDLLSKFCNTAIFNLIEYDPRGAITIYSNLTCIKLGNFCAGKQPEEIFDFEAFKKKLTISTNVTIENYFKYLDENIIEINGWIKNYDETSQIYVKLRELLDQYQTLVSNTKESYKNIASTTNLSLFFLNQLKNCKTIHDVNQLNLLRNFLFHDAKFADIGFLHKLLQSTSNSPKTLFVAGNVHARNTAHILSEIGYEVIAHKSIEPDFSEEKLQHFIDNLLKIVDLFMRVNNICSTRFKIDADTFYVTIHTQDCQCNN